MWLAPRLSRSLARSLAHMVSCPAHFGWLQIGMRALKCSRMSFGSVLAAQAPQEAERQVIWMQDVAARGPCWKSPPWATLRALHPVPADVDGSIDSEKAWDEHVLHLCRPGIVGIVGSVFRWRSV